jgi:hypothetical protein
MSLGPGGPTGKQNQSEELATDDCHDTDKHGESLSDSVGKTDVREAIRHFYLVGAPTSP